MHFNLTTSPVFAERMKAFTKLAKKARVDVIAIQESTPLAFQYLTESTFIKKHFYISDFTNQHSTYKVNIFSRYPFRCGCKNPSILCALCLFLLFLPIAKQHMSVFHCCSPGLWVAWTFPSQEGKQ